MRAANASGGAITPGNRGCTHALAAANSSGVRPGLTPNLAASENEVHGPADGADADKRSADLARTRLEREQRGRRAQRHLKNRHAAGDQTAGERHDDAERLDHDHRDDGPMCMIWSILIRRPFRRT